MERLRQYIHHLFIPSEKNNFRAKSLHIDMLTYYLLFAFIIAVVFKSQGANLSNVLGFATDISVDKLLQLTNKERERNNLSVLSYNQQLSDAARLKAQDMFTKNYWAHYGPNGSTPWDFILASHYQYEYAGENLAKNFLFSQGVVDAWMNSKTHRENLLRSEYNNVGFAVVNGILNGEETTLVVQMFGKPLSSLPIAKNNYPDNVYAKQSVGSLVIKQEPMILAQKTAKRFNFSFPLSFNLNVAFISFLIIALVMDFYFAAKYNIVRLSGKNVAHLIFLGFILLGVVVLTKGAII